MQSRSKIFLKTGFKVVLSCLPVLLPGLCYAAVPAHSDTFSEVVEHIAKVLPSIFSAAVAMAYVSGIAFVGAAIMKFKAHKDNPTQVQVGVPIAYLLIGASLCYLPTIVKTAGQEAGLSSLTNPFDCGDLDCNKLADL